VTLRAVVVIWTVALVAAANALALILTTDHADSLTANAALMTVGGLLFVGAGLLARYRRPENRMGVVMVVAGAAWFLGSFTQSNEPVLFSFGTAANDLPWAFFALLILSYPTGRLDDAASKAIVAGAFVLAGVLRPIWVLFNNLEQTHPDAPRNAFLVENRPGLSEAIETTIQVGALLLIAGAVAVLVRRWRVASPATRRTLSPAYLAFGATILLLASAVLLQALDHSANEPLVWAALGALLTVPLSFAVGLLRTRLARASVGNLVVELREARDGAGIRDAIARALGDPTVQIGYWNPASQSYIDSEGHHLGDPGIEDGRRAKIVQRGGRTVAAILYDQALAEDPDLLEAVAAAAALALENEQRVAALAESEARHRALLDALPDLMFRMSADGVYLDYKGNERDLAAPPEELVGRSIYDVLPADAAEAIMRCVAQVIERGGVQPVEYQLRIGPLNRHFEARIVRSGPHEVLLIVRDISDRKRTETQLRRLQDELRARLDDLQRERDFVRDVVQAAPSLFCLVDEEGHIVRFNRTLEQTLGVQDDPAVRGRPFWDVFIPPDERDEVRANFLARPGENESEWVTTSGMRLIVAWRVTPLVDERGEPRRLITGMDITERKHHEEELRRSRARIVEAASAERRRLERNLHDGAQQRLVSISLFLRLAEGKVETDPAGARDLLARASDELAHALEELRELARGIHPAILTDRGLEPAIQALVTRSPVPVTLAEAPEERLPENVEAAAYYVVSEALANVAKYAQASAATVRVARLDGRTVVEVADDGIGGADPTRGTGLRGLADRVEALDGILQVESRPGAGTTVRAEIPVA
jgi:PAS domain S-box-containing protein